MTVDLAAHAGHEPAIGLDDDVVAGAMGVRPFPAKGRVPDVDDARVYGRDGLVVDPELGGGVRPVVQEEDVRGLNEGVDDRLASGVAQVQGDAPLAAVERQEAAALQGLELGLESPGLAADGLDLDDVGAHIAEKGGGVGSGDNLRAVEDADSRELA